MSNRRVFERTNLPEPRSVLVDWMLRVAISVAFVVFGAEKLPSDSQSSWVRLFQEIGFGQWFRYLTGVVEMLGGVLVLIPWTATLGLAVLAGTMSAVLILVFVVGRPADSIVSAGFFIGLAVFGWSSRRR